MFCVCVKKVLLLHQQKNKLIIKTMKRQQHLQIFVQNNTKSNGSKSKSFIERYGDVSFEEAFEIYYKGVQEIEEAQLKLRKFEDFLIKEGAEMVQSSKSESRYYFYNGVKYRFSSHRYPTDSKLCYFDFGYDCLLINEVKFDIVL